MPQRDQDNQWMHHLLESFLEGVQGGMGVREYSSLVPRKFLSKISGKALTRKLLWVFLVNELLSLLRCRYAPRSSSEPL